MKMWMAVAVAFCAGLAPGLLLYWKSAATPVAVQSSGVKPVEPAPMASSAVPAAPAADVPLKAAKAAEHATAAHGSAESVVAGLQQQLLERNEKLNAAEQSIAETRARLSELEAKLSALTEQSSQAVAREKTLAQELDAAKSQIAGLQADVKARDAKLADLDAAQARAVKQNAEAMQKAAARTADLAGELEDIARRRENYLTQILGRYREATELFRALSLRLDNPRDGASPLSNDLSRIQQAIQHADEDMRQLRALNQGSARVLKDLAAARGKK